jgi:hypothetical protein
MMPVQIPGEPQQIPRKGLEITLHAVDEISVPLDSCGIDSEDRPAYWLRWSREIHKSKLLSNPKWGARLRGDANMNGIEDTVSEQYAESIRSALASPIGLVRSKRQNYWTQIDTWWLPQMFEMIDDETTRNLLKQNFPDGMRVTSVRGTVVDLQQENLPERWVECKPEPTQRIMCDPLGNDWTEVQDLADNYLNQCNELLDRSNIPMLMDAVRIDFDAWEQSRSTPASAFPMTRPAGGRLEDCIYQPATPQFSEQFAPFRAGIETNAQNDSGLTPSIWGEGDEPTARQSELKKNAALQQLGIQWKMIGKAFEKIYMKGCKLLAQYSDGVLAVSKKSQFGDFKKMAAVVADLKSDLFHFEADEAIPMTWGQQRDLMMWMLDKPAPLLEMWGFTDPMNIPEFKRLLGMPGERVPKFDELCSIMATIKMLLNSKPIPGPLDPTTGQPGPQQASLQPQWEEDAAFCALTVKAYLIANNKNGELETQKPDGVSNLRLWGQAQEQKANQPPPPPPPKVSITASFKGEDIGDQASQQMLTKAGMVQPGTPVQSFEQKQQNYRQGLGLPPQPVPELPPMPPPMMPAGALPPPGPASGIPTPPDLPQSLQ